MQSLLHTHTHTRCVQFFYDDAKPHPMMCIRINDGHDGFMRPKNEKHHMYIWVLVGELAYVHIRPQLVTRGCCIVFDGRCVGLQMMKRMQGGFFLCDRMSLLEKKAQEVFVHMHQLYSSTVLCKKIAN